MHEGVTVTVLKGCVVTRNHQQMIRFQISGDLMGEGTCDEMKRSAEDGLRWSRDTVTRGHCLKLAKRSNRTQLRNRLANMWNNLPQEVVTAPTVNCFKGHFNRYSADNRYSMEWRYVTTREYRIDDHPDSSTTRQNMKIGQQVFC